MNAETRRIVVGGSAVLGLGLVAGAVAFWLGGGPTALVAQTLPDELRYLPGDASVIAYANVRDVMQSSLRSRLRQVRPQGPVAPDTRRGGPEEPDGSNGDGGRQFREATGIDLETDIDHVLFGLVVDQREGGGPEPDEPRALVVLVGTFDADRLERLARDHGGTVEEHAGHSMLTGVPAGARGTVALSFVEPGVLVLGDVALVRQSIDVALDVAASTDVTSNDRLMELMGRVRTDHNVWAVAELDRVDAGALLPGEMLAQMPPLTALAFGSHVNGGIRANLNVEARDEQAAQNLRDVVQGFVALARMQAGSHPNLRPVLDSIRLMSDGAMVTVGFDLPPEVLDLMFPRPPQPEA